MEESKSESSDIERALSYLLAGRSVESIIDAVLKLIPEADLCQAMLRVFERQNVIMSPAFPGDAVMCSLGLGSTLVLSCGSANINVQPPEEFHLDRLIISSSVAGDFMVADIKVGGESQFDFPASLPGTAFAEDVFAIKLKGSLARRHQFVTVCVINQSASPQNFQGALIGRLANHPSPGIAGLQEEAA